MFGNNVLNKQWRLEKGKKKLVLTKDSKNLQDFKDYKPSKLYSDFASKKTHVEYYCKPHMKDRLKEYCNQDALVDVIFSGGGLEFSNCIHSGYPCHVKDCKTEIKFKLVRELV